MTKKTPAKDSTSPKAKGAQSRREILRAKQQAEAARQLRNRRIITVIAALVAVLIVTMVAVVVIQQQRRQKQEEELKTTAEQLTPANANAEGNALTYEGTGDENDPLVTIYADYQCPGCGTASSTIDLLLEELADDGEIRLEYHILYGLDRGLGTDHSQRAAIAGTCAAVVGDFTAYNHQVFNNQPAREGDGWTDEQLSVDFPAAISMTPENLDTFQSCYEARQTSDFVNKMQDSLPSYVRSTPSFVVNGQVMELSETEWTNKDALLAMIKSYA